MSTDVTMLLVQNLEHQTGMISVDVYETPDYKALIDTYFELNGQTFKVRFLASEARLYAEMPLDNLPQVLRNQLLSDWKINTPQFIKRFNPLEVQLWQGKQVFRSLPSLHKLLGTSNLKLELSTVPMTVEDPERVTPKMNQLYTGLRKALNHCFTAYTPSIELAPEGLTEGEKLEFLSKRYERSAQNRSVCLAFHGYRCSICDFSFEEHYGELGKQFIHVHHIEPLALSGPVLIDPIHDLIPVCPNCHAMLHRHWPPLKPNDLRKQLI